MAHTSLFTLEWVAKCSHLELREHQKVIRRHRQDLHWSIVGQVSSVDLKHCYWSDSIEYDVYGKQAYSEVSECFRFNNAFELEGTAFENNYAGSSLIDSLNAFSDEWYMNVNYSYWLLNEGRKNASFTIKRKGQGLYQTGHTSDHVPLPHKQEPNVV